MEGNRRDLREDNSKELMDKIEGGGDVILCQLKYKSTIISSLNTDNYLIWRKL